MLTRRDFLESTAQTALGLVIPAAWTPQNGAAPASGARLQLMRNATSIIRYGGKVEAAPDLNNCRAVPM